MIVIHEFGHFLFAKLFKVTVLEFSIGMGPAIFTTGRKKKKKQQDKNLIGNTFYSDPNSSTIVANSDTIQTDTVSDNEKDTDQNSENQQAIPEKTVFSIRAFPIGGYVSMAGEDEASVDKNAFCNKPVWQRLIITVAGAAMNILLGIICMFTLVGIESSQMGYLASNTVDQFIEEATSNQGPNALLSGDTVIKVEGVKVHTGNELVYEIMNSGYKPIDLVVIRDGKTITLEDVTFPTVSENGVAFGSYDFYVYREEASFKNILKHSFFRSFSSVKIIVDSLKDMITGRYGADAISGPVGMAGAVGTATQQGFSSLLFLFILITMNLGVFNLLPLPALDGGRIIFLLIELVFRKPVKKEIEQAVNTIGIILLLGLMLIITFKDVFTLFK